MILDKEKKIHNVYFQVDDGYQKIYSTKDYYTIEKELERFEKMKTKLSDIKITGAFKKTHPNLEKLLKCMTYYAKYKKLDRDIVVSKDNVLVDGYVGYLTLISLGIKKWKCVKDNTYQWFVQGKHPNSEKVYTWKLPDWLIIDGSPNIYEGKRYMIKTSRGDSIVKTTKVFISNKPPIDGNMLDFTFA